MSSKLFMLQTGNTSGSLNTSAGKIATGTGLRCLLQIAPTMGIEIVEWGVSFDGSAAATPGQVDLVEVDVAATAGTASQIPVSYLTGSVSAGGAQLTVNQSLQPVGNSTNYEVGVVTFGNYGGTSGIPTNEMMQVTGGGSTTTLSVLRNVNDFPTAQTYPTGTTVYAVPGTGVYSDLQPYGAMPTNDPTYALVCNAGSATAVGSGSATGFSFGSYNTPLKIRQGDMQLLPPTAPYVKQFPLERGFEIHPGRFGQIRCTFGSTVNAWAYLIFQA